jgi:hypothetical protein
MAVLGIILGSFDDEADYDPSRHGAAATYGSLQHRGATCDREIRRVRRFESVRRDALTRAEMGCDVVGKSDHSVMA